jgi:hypothetical protein
MISAVTVKSTGGSTSKLTGNTANVTITASDLFGVQSYHITDNSSYVPDASNNSIWDNFTSPGTSISATVAASFDNSTLSNGDTLTLYIWVRDAAQNTDNSSDTINYFIVN